MIIEKLELMDFLSHKSTTVSFGRGLTAIIGPNGAGKSSMIEGIVYSLFQDSFRNLRGGTKDSLKRIGAKSASVKLTFNVAGRKFKVERFIERGAIDKLYEEDKLIATQTSTVDKKILEILGIPRKEAYLNTVIVKQGELEDVLEAFTTASGREELMKALGFKELEDIAEALKEERNEFEKRYMKLMGEAAQLESWKKQLEKYEDELKKLEDDRIKILENLKALEKGLSYVEKALGDLPESLEQDLNDMLASYYRLKSSMEQADREINRLREELERLRTLKAELNNLRSILAFKEKFQYLQKTLEKAIIIYPRLEELRSTVYKLEDKLTRRLRLLAQTLQCPPDIDSIIRAYEDLKAEVELKEREVSSLKATIEEKKAMLNSLEKSGDTCPLCGAKLTNEAKLRVREKIEMEVNKVALELEEVSKILNNGKKLLRDIEKMNIAGLVDELDALSEEKRKKEDEERRYLDYMSDVNRHLEEILSSEISGEISLRLKELIEVVDSPSEAMRVIREISDFIGRIEGRAVELKKTALEEEDVKLKIERLEEEREKLRVEAANLEKRIEDIKRKVEIRRKLVEESNKIKAQIAENKGRLSGIERSIEGYKKRIDELKELCSKAESAEHEATRIKSFISFIDYLRSKVFGKDGIIAKQLRRAYKAKLEGEVNSYLSRFGMDFEVEFDDDLKLKVIVRGEEMSIDSLSGGERAVLALSTRLALAKALSSREVEFVILDEPTANLDVDRRRELVRVLRDLADEVPQVVVVTHDPEVAEAADQVYRVKKVNGISVVEEE